MIEDKYRTSIFDVNRQDVEKEGLGISTQRRRDLAVYLDELGGVYILDCLPEKRIHDKILQRAEELEETADSHTDNGE